MDTDKLYAVAAVIFPSVLIVAGLIFILIVPPTGGNIELSLFGLVTLNTAQIGFAVVVVGVVLFYAAYRLTPKLKVSSVQDSREELHEQIKRGFRLYKATLGALSGDTSWIRVSFLKYLPSTNSEDEVLMLIQDDEGYEDQDFSKSITEGVDQKIVVCEAAKQEHPWPIARTVPKKSHSLYEDSEIPDSVRSVIAYQVRYKSSVNSSGKSSREKAGVVALDFTLPLAEIHEKGITDLERLRETFMKLCNFVAELIADYQDQIKEI